MSQLHFTIFIIILSILFDNNAKLLAPKCVQRYLTHYDGKRCIPVYEDGPDCPSRYNCSEKPAVEETVCYFKGQTYQYGEMIDIGLPCFVCICGIEDGLNVFCARKKCVYNGDQQKPGCYYLSELDKCCSKTVHCAENVDQHATGKEAICEYNGEKYKYGEIIEVVENQCKICNCNEKWPSIGHDNCRDYEYDILLHKEVMEKGCIPIYHEAICYPIEFYCGDGGEKQETHSFPTFASHDEISAGTACKFKGKYYSIGDTLDIHTNCVTCTCVIPPDFTCIQKDCQSPPAGK